MMQLLRKKAPWDGQVAVRTPRFSMTYKQLQATVAAAGARLRHAGLAPGESLAIRSADKWQTLLAVLGCIEAGMVAAPISPLLPAPALPALLEGIGCRALAADSQEISRRELQAIDLRLPLEALMENEAPLPRPAAPAKKALSQPATIIFTSGSAAEPKAALHTFGNHYFSARGANHNMPLLPGDCWLLSLPLYHVGGLAVFFRTACAGAALAVPAAGQPLAEAISRFAVTHISLVPAQLYDMVQIPETVAVLQRLKAILLGGSAVPETLLEQALRLRLPIYTTYGCTEMASQVTTSSPGESPEKLRTSGRLLPYRRLRLSEAGEILVKGETLFRGYVRGGAVEPAVGEDGWFATGDLGEIDEQGYLQVRGRRDNMFISGGENIQPEEIERALCQLPGVVQAVIVPVPEPKFGHRPVAFILKSGEEGNFEAIREALRQRLPKFKIPDCFFPWPEAGATAGMKISRRALQQLAMAQYRKP